MNYFDFEIRWSFEGLPSEDSIHVLIPAYDMETAMKEFNDSKYSTGEIISSEKTKYSDVLSVG